MGDSLASLSTFDAQRLITSLRTGTVPAHHLRQLTVGREDLLDSLNEDLEFVSAGGSKVRLLAASYGGGKTHLLTLLRDEALANRFLVSYVELHSREAPFDKFEVLYSKVMQGLQSATAEAGVEEVLDVWVRTTRLYDLRALETALAAVTSSPDLRNAVKTYVTFAEGSGELHLQLRNGVLSWLYGARLPAAVAGKVGVRGPISITNVSDVFRSFLRLTRAVGFPGMVLLLDEAEAVTSLERSQRRNDANQNLRKLLDNTDNNEGLFVVFATTPRFLDDPDRGAKSYPALWDRIRPVLRPLAGVAESRGPVMQLRPLAGDQLVALAARVLVAYAKAYRWDHESDVDNAALSKYVKAFLSSQEPNSVRAFVRGWVTILDAIGTPEGLSSIDSLLDEVDFDQAEQPV